MANIDTYLTELMSATYGDEVRTALHNALSTINTTYPTDISTAITNLSNTINALLVPTRLTDFTVNASITLQQNDVYRSGYIVNVCVSLVIDEEIAAESTLISGLPYGTRSASYQRMFWGVNVNDNVPIRLFFSNNTGVVGTKVKILAGTNVRFTYTYTSRS
jgi:hypothetical protein